MAGYSIIKQYDSEIDEKSFFPVVVGGARQSCKRVTSLMAIALLVSLSFNVYNVMHSLRDSDSEDQAPSKYGTWPKTHPSFTQILTLPTAGLYRNVPTEIVEHTDYNSPNRTIENAAWNSPDLLPEHGFIALHNSWAAAKDLPPTQPWPWDDTKGIYILTSSHELHCVVSITSLARTAR